MFKSINIILVLTFAFYVEKSSAQIYQPVNCNLFQGCTCSLKTNVKYDIQCLPSEKLRPSFPLRNNLTLQPLIGLLMISSYNFTTIPPRIFQGLNIESLFLTDNNLINITKESFAAITSLRYLNIFEKLLNIEPDTFRTINALEELSLSGQLTDDKLEQMRTDLINIKNLKSFSLATNNLTSFDIRYTQFMSELQSLDLSQNNIRYFTADVFRNLTKLQILSLSFNPLNDSQHLFNNVLRPIQNNIVQLYLKNNQISNLTNMSGYTNLAKLDLSSNMISKLNNRLENMVNLSELYLSNNKLEEFDNRAGMTKKLNILDLKNNMINKFPNISELSDLGVLILSNQNNKLQTIPNFAFERMMPTKKLHIDLRSNQFTKIENKAFCSRFNGQQSSIGRVQMSYTSARLLDKCHLKQMADQTDNTTQIRLEIDGMDNTTNLICSCDFREFAARFRIKLSGNCSLFNEGSCNNFNRTWPDDCNTKLHLVCGNLIMIDEKSQNGTTTTSGCLRFHSLKEYNLYSLYFVLFIFVYLF
jgi:Leucine-rich repeat (LRR) protein